MRSMFCGATVFTFLLICSITASAVPSVREEFKVTEVFLKADDGRPTGPCPLRVTFRGYITADGPGTIKYTFTRSDGATGPVYIMEFKRAGTQAVMTDWTLGDPKVLPRYAGWQAVKVLSPVEIESSHETGSFEINCKGADVAETKDLNPKGLGDHAFVNADSGRLTAAYELALPAMAEAQLVLFRTKLEKLKSLNDELELKLNRAPKSVKFDKRQLQKEFSAIVKEPDFEKRNKQIEEFRDRYEQQLEEQLSAAGIDFATERQRMALLLGMNTQEISRTAAQNAQRMLALTTVSEAVDDRPPVEAAPLFYTDDFGCPFTGAGVQGPGTANHRDGTLAISSDSTFGNPSLARSLAFVTQYMSARPGARRIIMSVALNDLNLSLSGIAIYGFASAEAAVILRIFKDGRVVASRRVSLLSFDGILFGLTSSHQVLAARTLELEITGPESREPGHYLMAVEFESLASSFLGGSANVRLKGRVGPFTVRTY